MKLLLVEDDELVADSLSRALRAGGHSVDSARDGEHAEIMITTEAYDVVMLDLGLPGIDGLELLKRVRAKKITVPILILTARDSYEERISGLDSGANDYVTKPFHLGELEARLRALYRLSNTNVTSISIGQLTFDSVGRTLKHGDEIIELSPREYTALEALLMNAGNLVPKERMAMLLSDWESSVSFNAIDIIIHRLRKKLEPFGLKIQTVRGLGYVAQG